MSHMSIFIHRFFSFTPSKPRHPLMRLVCGLFGLVVLALLVVFGLFIGIGMLLFAAVRRMVRSGPVAAEASRVEEGVIDGEFAVVEKNRASLGMR
jgi:uncharacterized membrane protein YdjX (TVP38/TMEM64 family)